MSQLRIIAIPDIIDGSISVPSSKSITNRALMLKALANPNAEQPCELLDIAASDDVNAMFNGLFNTGRGRKRVYVGAAGTAMRFLTAFLAIGQETVRLEGNARMYERPIGLLVDALRSLGADISYLKHEGYPPLLIRGTRLHGGELTLDGSVSSQYISALLMIAPGIGGLKLTITGTPTSRPYIDMTLKLMSIWGIDAKWHGDSIVVPEGTYRDVNYRVEGDWSAAAYWVAWQHLLPMSHLRLDGVRLDSELQGDRAIMSLLEQADSDQRLEADLSDVPDLAQTIVTYLCLKGFPFNLTGLHTLRVKETDRIAAMATEMAKLGYRLHAGDSSLAWDGTWHEPADKRIVIDTYNDHRMAMALSLAAVKFPGIYINNPEVVSKSYPDYWTHLRSLGAHITYDK